MFGFSGLGHAQTLSTYLERSWKGSFKESSELFVGGDYSMSYSMYNVQADDVYNTFSATMSGTINIDGYLYTSVWAITGSVSSNYTVYLNYSYTISADQLPNGLYWIYDSLSGTLYEDIDHPGNYIIHGTKPNSNGVFEIVTYY